MIQTTEKWPTFQNDTKWSKVTYNVHMSISRGPWTQFIYTRIIFVTYQKKMTCHQNPGPADNYDDWARSARSVGGRGDCLDCKFRGAIIPQINHDRPFPCNSHSSSVYMLSIRALLRTGVHSCVANLNTGQRKDVCYCVSFEVEKINDGTGGPHVIRSYEAFIWNIFRYNVASGWATLSPIAKSGESKMKVRQLHFLIFLIEPICFIICV
jgi:hypothetical protein